jgi:hypothetical protein
MQKTHKPEFLYTQTSHIIQSSLQLISQLWALECAKLEGMEMLGSREPSVWKYVNFVHLLIFLHVTLQPVVQYQEST